MQAAVAGRVSRAARPSDAPGRVRRRAPDGGAQAPVQVLGAEVRAAGEVHPWTGADSRPAASGKPGKQNHERESARQGARPRMKLSEAKGRPLTNSEMLITSFVADAGVEAADRQASSGMPTMLV